MSRFLNLINKDSPLDCPYLPSCKSIDPLLGGAIIGGLSSVLGGIFGSNSQSSANAVNERIADKNIAMQRETNQLNADLVRETNKQNYDIYKENQIYNSIGEQMARAKSAHVNPMAALGQQAESTPVSMVAPHADAPQSNAKIQAYDWFPSMHGAAQTTLEALNYGSVADVNRSQANYNNVKAENEQRESIARIAEMMSNVRKGSAEYKILSKQYELASRTLEDQVAMVHQGQLRTAAEVDKIKLDAAVTDLQRQLLSIDVKWKDKFNAAQLRAMDAGTAQAISAAALNDANAVKAHAESAVQAAVKAGLDIDNKQKSEMVDAIVQKAYYEADNAQFIAGKTRLSYVHGKVGETLGAGVLYENSKYAKLPDYSYYHKE